jgi:hypothetical protein
MTEKTICTICGVTAVSWVEKKLGQAVAIRRDYMPTKIVFRLKPETTSLRWLHSGGRHHAQLTL